jgi:LCP family protein required for cell wall assembly
MTRSVRLIAIVAAAVVLLGAGVFAGVQLLRGHVDKSIPQTDLFGPSESPSASPSPTGSPAPPPGADIKGPLNILIIGLDTRESIPGWIPHADAVMILHVDKDLTHAYLTSLPRDLVVSIPAFPPANFGGQRTKLTHAMSFGSRVPGSKRANPAQGFQLVAKTVSKYTGITRFDAGALLTFTGFGKLVNVLGGIDIYIDQKVVSIHRRPDGAHRAPCASCEHGYSGPRATYNVGTAHLVGWQALDYARQRYIPGSDYARQRHQRQLIKAIIAKAMKGDILTNPATFENALRALGSTLTFDGRGRTPSEFAYAVRNLRPENMTLVGLPGAGVYSGGQYLGEALGGVQSSYFAALRKDDLVTWATSHATLVNAR